MPWRGIGTRAQTRRRPRPPLLGRGECEETAAKAKEDRIKDGDLELINAPVDFLGLNYYFPQYLRPGDSANLGRNEYPAGIPGVVEYRPEELSQTTMDWPWLIDPDSLYELLTRVSKEAPGLPLYVTENGRAAEDYVTPDGIVNDIERIEYLHGHLSAAARAIKDGVNLAGYYVWSLLDNFEWAYGYQKRQRDGALNIMKRRSDRLNEVERGRLVAGAPICRPRMLPGPGL